VSSFIRNTERRGRRKKAAMTYPIENFDNDNFLSLVDMSFGVAIQDVISLQSLISVSCHCLRELHRYRF
jgi:hypothetical protein